MLRSRYNINYAVRLAVGLTICMLLSACASVVSADRPASYYTTEPNSAAKSLLNQSIIGQDDTKINALLQYKVRLPQVNRIAILKLSSDSYWQFYSNDFTVLNDNLVQSLVTKLRNSSRVYDASFLPAMLVPEKRTMPILRESAARFQADLLLAYRSQCNSYKKYRILAANQTKAYCSVEAVLLDVRSGIILKSIVSTEDFIALENTQQDSNFAETVKKAELEAVAKNLGNVADEISSYLEKIPVL